MTMNNKLQYSILILFCCCFFVFCKNDKSVNSSAKTTSIPQKKVAEISTQKVSTAKPSIDTVNTSSELENNKMVLNGVEKDTIEKINKPNISKIQTPPAKPKKKKKKKSKAKIEFEELVWDFGEITEGDIVSKKFKFTNTGTSPLQIKATSATCGCTTPSFPFLDIDPGDSNVIGVTYNSVGKDGHQTPEITVESNTTPKVTVLKLTGTVIQKKEEGKDKTQPSIVKDSLQ